MPSVLKARHKWGRRKGWKDIHNKLIHREHICTQTEIMAWIMLRCCPSKAVLHTERKNILHAVNSGWLTSLHQRPCVQTPFLVCGWQINEIYVLGKAKKGDDLSRDNKNDHSWSIWDVGWLLDGWDAHTSPARCLDMKCKLFAWLRHLWQLSLCSWTSSSLLQSLWAGWFSPGYWWAAAPRERHFAFAQAEANNFRVALVAEQCLIPLES